MEKGDLLSRLIEARRKLSERRERQLAIKPHDAQAETILGCKMKGLQQAIDIAKQYEKEQMERLCEEGFAAHRQMSGSSLRSDSEEEEEE